MSEIISMIEIKVRKAADEEPSRRQIGFCISDEEIYPDRRINFGKRYCKTNQNVVYYHAECVDEECVFHGSDRAENYRRWAGSDGCSVRNCVSLRSRRGKNFA